MLWNEQNCGEIGDRHNLIGLCKFCFMQFYQLHFASSRQIQAYCSGKKTIPPPVDVKYDSPVDNRAFVNFHLIILNSNNCSAHFSNFLFLYVGYLLISAHSSQVEVQTQIASDQTFQTKFISDQTFQTEIISDQTFQTEIISDQTFQTQSVLIRLSRPKEF